MACNRIQAAASSDAASHVATTLHCLCTCTCPTSPCRCSTTARPPTQANCLGPCMLLAVSWEGDTEVLAKLQLDSQEYTLKLVQGESSTGQKAVSLSLVPPGSQKLRTAERSVVFQLFALHQMPGDAAGTDGGTSLVEVLPPMMPEKETGVNESMGDADGVGRWLGIPAMKLPAPAGAQIAVGVRVKHVSLEAQ